MTKESDSLQEYRKRRDFHRTGEPAGGRTQAKQGEKPLFVIQKHDARNLHYDFRLEVSGVLKSWAVPKGPSTNPADRRLAVPTEDHPLEYADFEGVIPKGEYGAGVVLVWDTGTYRNLSAEKDEPASMEESLQRGHVEVWLKGRKLQGAYALIRTGGGDRWLLIKMKDDRADARRNPVSTEPDSVLTGRSLEEIRREEGRGDEEPS